MGTASGRSKQPKSFTHHCIVQPLRHVLTTRILSKGATAPAATAIAFIGTLLSPLAAQAEALREWRYDIHTRSLNVILPDDITPHLSVLGPDQLLLELPDTQIGEVAGQTIDDGIVESIVLEQTNPDTVWMVVEFAPGTVLAGSQEMRQMDTANDDLKQWQVRPNLVAASRTREVPVATETRDTSTVATEPGSSAADMLRQPDINLAQAPDFPELPVLESSVSINGPVSVPPIGAPGASIPARSSLEPPTLSTEERPSEDLPVVDMGAELEEAPIADIPVIPAGAQALPAQPPFLTEDLSEDTGNLANDSEDPFPTDSFNANSGLEGSPTVAVPDIGNPPARSQTEVAEAVPFNSGFNVSRTEPSLEADAISTESFSAPTPAVQAAPATQPSNSAAVTPANTTNRWPEPIPFGQPLPN